MSTAAKTVHPMARAVFAIIALLIIVVALNIIVSKLGIGHKNADFTVDKVHTLSDGTKAILSDLPAPVEIRYYATRSSKYMPEAIKLHMRRVDDLLAQYKNLSKGKLRVKELDPQPDTDAEDSANLDGISGQQFDDQNLYFGLAISCLDRTATIPMLDPRQETLLEYQLSRGISEVSRPKKPVIGLMSALPLAGTQSMQMMGGPPASPAWFIYDELKQNYEVRDLTMTPEKIDPSIDVLLVFHPAGITPAAEYAIDQYVLQGGTVVACIDPFSVQARMSPGNPMTGEGQEVSSTLPTLLGSWGLTMEAHKVLGDGKYKTQLQGARGEAKDGLAVLTVPEEAMPQKDDVITRGLGGLVLYLPGGLTKTGSAGVTATTLVKSSGSGDMLDPELAANLDEKLARSFQGQRGYDLVVRLKGTFKSAFPKGKPGTEEPKADGEKKDEKKEDKPTGLVDGIKEGNVFVIADVDAFADRFAFNMIQVSRTRFQNMGPKNGNAPLFMNIVDQAASSSHLIGARSRAAMARPFTRINEMQEEFNKNFGKAVAEKQGELDKVNKDIQTLDEERRKGSANAKELDTKVKEARAKQRQYNKELREMEKNLQTDKDKITASLTMENVLGMPGVVLVLGGIMLLARRRATRAR